MYVFFKLIKRLLGRKQKTPSDLKIAFFAFVKKRNKMIDSEHVWRKNYLMKLKEFV